jgi:two-component system, LytTR family, sensor kinase
MRIQQFIDSIYTLLTKRVAYHVLFWMLFFAILVAVGRESGLHFESQLRNEFLSLLFYMAAVYINVRILIPRYLARHAFFYVLSVLILTVLITPIKIFVLYLIFSDSNYYQAMLISNQAPLYIGMLFVVMVSTVLKILSDWWRYQQEKQELITQSMQSELRFLRSQINPHFLFNTLNNLYALALTKNDKAPEVVLKLAEIMRYMLYDCNERRVNIQREIDFMENYISLERIRLPKGAEVQLSVEGEVKNHMIVPLLFVPFLENSFKHGLNRHLDSAGYVHIRLKIQDDHLTFFIENSKPINLPENLKPHQGGIGLRNLRSRLKMHYPFRHHLEIKDLPDQYTALLQIELQGYHALDENRS